MAKSSTTTAADAKAGATAATQDAPAPRMTNRADYYVDEADKAANADLQKRIKAKEEKDKQSLAALRSKVKRKNQPSGEDLASGGDAADETDEASAASATRDRKSGKDDAVDAATKTQKARANLKLRLGYTDEELDSMNDDATTKLWSRVAERESRADALREENAQLKKSRRDANEVEPRDGQRTERKAPANTSPLDRFETSLSRALGEDDAHEVVEPLREIVDELRSENGALKQSIEAQTAEYIRDAKAELAELVPELADDDVFADVAQEMKHLGRSPRYRNISEERGRREAVKQLVLAAARSLGLKERPKKGTKPSNATPAAGSQRSANGQDMTPKERATRAYLHLKRNPKDVDGARRAQAG